MRGPDIDREQSEKRLTLKEFLTSYNEGLPVDYPRASTPILNKFTTSHPELFKNTDTWSLDQHRKKVMDWLPSFIRANTRDQ